MVKASPTPTDHNEVRLLYVFDTFVRIWRYKKSSIHCLLLLQFIWIFTGNDIKMRILLTLNFADGCCSYADTTMQLPNELNGGKTLPITSNNNNDGDSKREIEWEGEREREEDDCSVDAPCHKINNDSAWTRCHTSRWVIVFNWQNASAIDECERRWTMWCWCDRCSPEALDWTYFYDINASKLN